MNGNYGALRKICCYWKTVTYSRGGAGKAQENLPKNMSQLCYYPPELIESILCHEYHNHGLKLMHFQNDDHEECYSIED